MDKKLTWIPVVSGALVLVLSVLATVWTVSRPQPVTNFSAKANLDQTIVSIFPQKATLSLKTKEGFPVGLLLESNEKPIDKIDIVIGFDPNTVEASLLTRGMVFDSYSTMNIDNSMGIIRVVAENKELKPVNGILASFKIKAKTPGIIKLEYRQMTGADKGNGAEYEVK